MTPSASALFILFLQIISHLATTSSAKDPLAVFCSDDTYTSPSPFASSLPQLIEKLLDITPTSKERYSINTAGPKDFPLVFGLGQCLPYTTASVCHGCLARAADSAFNGTQCALRKSASIRNAKCVLRYAGHLFFSVVEDSYFTDSFQDKGGVNSSAFSLQVSDMLTGLLPKATASPMRIAAGLTAIDSEPVGQSNLEIYGLAWCTLDLSPEDCYQCLDHALKNYEGCCGGNMGGGVMSESCIVTYDNYPFFNLTLLQASSSPQSEIGMKRRSNNERKLIMAISIIASISALTMCCIILIIRRRRLTSRRTSKLDVEEDLRTVESPLLSLSALKAATTNFCNENKLREGRFGPVYKGELGDGRKIEVKRLSNASGQGLVELRNEAALVAQLQHKNLVKLLGCCLEEDENLLAYEYLANASLDKHLIDPAARAQLNWKMRHTIIEGIGRGLVYLHNHSRLRIIHRDLNSSNILLDADMNPKISDFGLAKLVGINESLWDTKQISGTCNGYMAPEYAARGLFSTKSDVFSYGMVVLEIITGRRNGSFIRVGRAMNLQTYVWQHWNQGKAEEVVDQVLGGVHQMEEVLRCINIGLLCVQEDPALRPSMARVVLMLSTNIETLPSPSPPGYFTGENPPSAFSETLSAPPGANFDITSVEHLSGSSRCWRKLSMDDASLDIMQAR